VKCKAIFLLAAVLSAVCVSAQPQVDLDSVQFSQDPETRKVAVSYVLRNAPAVITLDIQTNTVVDASGDWVSIGAANIRDTYGEVNCVVTNLGLRSVAYWQPDIAWSGHDLAAGQLRAQICAWSLSSPPDYMVIDLVRTNSVEFYVSKEQIPGGVTAKIYKTEKLVMRRIHASGVEWRMGAPAGEVGQYDDAWKTLETTHKVTLSSDYYMSVFEFTQGQNKNLKKASGYTGTYTGSDRAVHPYDYVSFNDERGDAGLNSDWNWPAGKGVKSSGLYGRLRSWAGIDSFDMPTEAQWEFACRGGTGTGLNNGTELAYNNDPMASGVVGWCRGVEGNDLNNTQEVGLKVPNAWGIYDMHGNVAECCRDWWYDGALGNLNQMTDPEGPETGTYRVVRGGAYLYWPFFARSGCRSSKATPDTWGTQTPGFRVVCEVDVSGLVGE